MRNWNNLVSGFALIVGLATAVAATAERRNAAVCGIWRGEADDLPAVVLNLTDEAGPLQGAILFYLIRRDEGKPPTSSAGVPEPLFDPRFDGKSLTFRVSHRRAHADTASDPPVTFRFDLTGPSEAKLIRIPQDGPAYVRMTRENSK